MFNTIKNNTEVMIKEKKSKFIANIFYVESEAEARERILQIKKKYYDAKHNVFAYQIIEDENVIKKQSDDRRASWNRRNTNS